MDVRLTEKPEMVGWSNELTADSDIDDVMVTFSGGKTADVAVTSLEVRLSDGTWKAMDEAFRAGDLITHRDDNTAFFELHRKQAGIAARTVKASLRDVQTAAAQLARHRRVSTARWCTSAENTNNGVVMRGPWPSTGGAGDSGTWTATYEVEPAEPGRSTLSGIFVVARAGEFASEVLLESTLAAVADEHTTLLEFGAEHHARRLSERPVLSDSAGEDGLAITREGRLVDDPELRVTVGGTPVTRFRIAVAEKDGTTTEHTIVAWDKTAIAIGKHMKKDDGVRVTGREKTNTWTGRDGAQHERIVLGARRVEFLPPERHVEQRRDLGGGMGH